MKATAADDLSDRPRAVARDYVLVKWLPPEKLEGTSRYSDNTWWLGPAERMNHTPNLSLKFERVPPTFRALAKELFGQLLNDDLAPNGHPYAISSIRLYFGHVDAFLHFLNSKGIEHIRDVTAVQLAEYVGFLSGRGLLHEANLRGPRLLWLYRSRLSDSLSADPEALPVWRAAPTAGRSEENATLRIPESVLEPLIWWSCRFIDDLSGDILCAQAHHRRLITTVKERAAGNVDSSQQGDNIARVLALLDKYRESGKPLPGHSSGRSIGRPNYRALDREAGVPTGSTIRMADYKVRALAAVNGVDADTYLAITPSGLLCGSLWKDRIAYREVPELCMLLQTAAYVIIAFFSGMRDSEVKHVRRGCVHLDSDATGKLAMHVLEGTTFKGNRSQTGEPARWVVAPIVPRAIKVLEALTDEKIDFLFHPLRTGTSHDRRDTQPLVSSKETRENLRKLVAWSNAYAANKPKAPTIPDFEGRTWAFTSRQFRRTLAWFIARRPGGMAAGALQYKHMSLQMFRGYAGESASGFADEIAAERSVARGEWLGEFATEAESLVGRAKDEVVRRLDKMGRALGFAGRLPDNPAQLARFLKHHDPHIYKGAAVTCVFDSSKALCLRKDSNTPEFQTCEPLKCGNAVFTPADIRVWRERAEGLTEVAGNEALAPRVRASAADHATRLTRFLDSMEAAE